MTQSNFTNAVRFFFVVSFVCITALYGNRSTAAEKFAKTATLQSANQAPPLDFAKRGYLLISLSSIEVAASFEFSMLRRRSDEYVGPGRLKRRKDQDYRVSLHGLNKGFYLLDLPQGWYQITHVRAPYFDLPFRLDVGMEPAWRFQIQANRVNYVGHLFISKERSTNYVEISLKNHLATEYNMIDQQVSKVLPTMPLRYGGGVRDDFWTDYIRTSP